MTNVIFLAQQNNWDKIFNFIFDVFLFVFDIIWNTKLPMTNISIAYLILFFMMVKLSVYAIHGTSTRYNELGATVKSGINSSKYYAKNAQYKSKQ